MILALDQASKTAFSVWDKGKLITYGTEDYSKVKNRYERIENIKNYIEGLIKKYNPDKIYLEDIQMQHNNVKTYRFLAELLGVICNYFYINDIEYSLVQSTTWKSYVGINTRNKRDIQKLQSIEIVKKMFGIDVNDNDVADAVLIGKYGDEV